jgi:hypothetical protein
MELRFFAAQAPNAYVVGQTWPRAGTWIMAIRASCGETKAGAIVPVNAQGIVRESSRFFSRAPTKSEIDAMVGGSAQSTCPVTRGPAFTPPPPYPQVLQGGVFFGNPNLWVALLGDGEWHVHREKIAWWSTRFDGPQEPQPLTITGRRLDGDASPLKSDSAANGSHTRDMGWFIMTAVDFSTEGCWEITGHYKGEDLKFVVLVKGGSQ